MYAYKFKNTQFSKSKKDTSLGAIAKNPNVLRALDRVKLSSRDAFHVLKPVCEAVGSKEPISPSTFERDRKEVRAITAQNILDSYEPPQCAVVHFDGKHLGDLGGDFGERLAVVLSGDTHKEGKLLSCEMIKNSTGKEQAAEVYRSLKAGTLKLLGIFCRKITSIF